MFIPSAASRSYADTPWACLGVAVIGTFMATLDGGIVSVALPVIAQGFAVSLPQAQWVVSAYLLTISCLLPVAGRLGDMTGRRDKYCLGFVLFALASALCGLAGSIGLRWWRPGCSRPWARPCSWPTARPSWS